MIDRVHGGMYGRMSADHTLESEADKSIILHCRALWFFSEAYKVTGDTKWLDNADHIYTFLNNHFVDRSFGGVYWMVDYRGNPVDNKKQIYAQAFAIYSLSAYGSIANREDAIVHAIIIFELIERHAVDSENEGYWEAFTRDWVKAKDPRLSQKDAWAEKTMNTHLHILEAYSTLFEVTKSKDVLPSLEYVLRIYIERFISPTTGHLNLFYTHDWIQVEKIISFGHDIESAWLILEACTHLKQDHLKLKGRNAARQLIDGVLSEGLSSSGAVWDEVKNGILHPVYVWWVQAEAVTGLLHGWKEFKKEEYKEKAEDIWKFIKDHMIEWKEHQYAEWYWEISSDLEPATQFEKAGPWKCPYHNGRMCLESMKLLQ